MPLDHPIINVQPRSSFSLSSPASPRPTWPWAATSSPRSTISAPASPWAAAATSSPRSTVSAAASASSSSPMGDSSAAGALVPFAPKPDAAPSGDASTAVAQALAEEAGTLARTAVADGEAAAPDRDLLCPICMAVIKDAFLTACGHSFCYMCIVAHLSHKSGCPCCGNYLTKSQLFPNFLLDKVLKKMSARQIAKTASPVDQFRYVLQQVATILFGEQACLLHPLSDRSNYDPYQIV